MSDLLLSENRLSLPKKMALFTFNLEVAATVAAACTSTLVDKFYRKMHLATQPRASGHRGGAKSFIAEKRIPGQVKHSTIGP